MSTRDEALEALARVAAQDDDAIDLAETALALATLDRPRVSLDRYRDHLVEPVWPRACAAPHPTMRRSTNASPR